MYSFKMKMFSELFVLIQEVVVHSFSLQNGIPLCRWLSHDLPLLLLMDFKLLEFFFWWFRGLNSGPQPRALRLELHPA
jgi:hypothetical protein